MINSLFMLGASFNKNRKISAVFIIGWILYMILGNKFALGNTFVLINAGIFFITCISINLIKNRELNTMLSVVSILIWSILIDIICFFMYPQMTFGQNIIQYIWQGIIFNYKYIFTNIIAIAVIYLLDLILGKIEIKMKEKYVSGDGWI